MNKLSSGIFLLAAFFAFWLSAPSLWAAEVPDPTLCDSESKEVRQGRPGGAEVKVVDGIGPMAKMKRTQEVWSSAAKLPLVQAFVIATLSQCFSHSSSQNFAFSGTGIIFVVPVFSLSP